MYPPRMFSSVLLLSIALTAHSQQWSSWSSWSECSRLCDGGASYQQRHCSQGATCLGDAMRYRTCNTQPCPAGSRAFRAQQCSVYDDDANRWQALERPGEPCSLWCQAVGTTVNRKLAPTVLDGTRCNKGGSHMCVNGVCKAVGCDGILGSGISADNCGVCGGDGSSCGTPPSPLRPYIWEETTFSVCSVTCGVGIQKTTVHCKDSRNNVLVYDWYCDKKKPPHRVKSCTRISCHPVWLTSEWMPCSRWCGGGQEMRTIYCVIGQRDGTFQKTSDVRCPDVRPPSIRRCNQHPCPQWIAGQWSPCSVTCGIGQQYREVICRKTESHTCLSREKPAIQRPCGLNVSCLGEKAETAMSSRAPLQGSDHSEEGRSPDTSSNQLDKQRLYNDGTMSVGENDSSDTNGGVTTPVSLRTVQGVNQKPKLVFEEESNSLEDLESRTKKPMLVYEEPSPLVEEAPMFVLPKDSSPAFQEGRQQETYWFEGAGPEKPVRPPVQLVPGQELQGEERPEEGSGIYSKFPPPWEPDSEEARLSYGKLPSHDGSHQQQAVSSVPSFITSLWSPCSTTCGEGIRHRRVLCKVFLEFTQEVQTLPDDQCFGPKPPSSEVCSSRECEENAVPTDSHAWQYVGYGPCSASCTGGVQQPLFVCVRASDFKMVADVYCAGKSLPPLGPRECNNVPCPPSWRIGEFGLCSASCGGGQRSRVVRCVQTTSSGQERVLPEEFCNHAKPARLEYCGLENCPPEWYMSEWSSCSATCGEGVEVRVVECHQFEPFSQSHVTVDAATCVDPEPSARRPCAVGKICRRPEGPYIEEETSVYTQIAPMKRLLLNVGGLARIVPGTSLAVRCPVKGFDRRQLQWTHLNLTIPRKGRVKCSPSGVLRLRKSRVTDEGIYTCWAGDYTADIEILYHTIQEAYRMTQLRRHLIMSNYNFIQAVEAGKKKSGGSHRDQYSLAYMLRVVNVTMVPFYFVPADWSTCSKSCGGAGLQSRLIACEIVMDTYYLGVEQHWCLDTGRIKPLDTRDCGFQKCPIWDVGLWQSCSADLCMAPGTGSEKRGLNCVAYNGSQVPLAQCDQASRPLHKRPCPHSTCRPVWKATAWTKCSRSCGGEGMQTRALKCVWDATKLPAGRACRGLTRPKTMNKCMSPPCGTTVCRDESKYCTLIPMLHMCRYEAYRRECCHACSHHNILHQEKYSRRRRRFYFRH